MVSSSGEKILILILINTRKSKPNWSNKVQILKNIQQGQTIQWPKEKGQTIQWPKEKGQTIQWPKEKGQTIQWPEEKGQTIQWPKEKGQTIQWPRDKRQRKLKGQSRMDKQETLATLGTYTRHRTKINVREY